MKSMRIETKDFSAAVHAIETRAKRRDVHAYARFKEPPYYMRFLESWTTGREEDDACYLLKRN